MNNDNDNNNMNIIKEQVSSQNNDNMNINKEEVSNQNDTNNLNDNNINNLEDNNELNDDLFIVKVANKYKNLYEKSPFDKNKNILLIDTSYMIFHKFFALRNWYYKAHPDKNIPDDYDWLSDEVFMTKYKKLFFENLVNLCKINNVQIGNVVFAIDCKHTSIWRNKEMDQYKGTRKESHQKSKFYSYKIFGIVIDDILPIIVEKYGCIVLKHNNCEADDIVANCVFNLKGEDHELNNLEINNQHDNENINKKIFIVATDTDYIQICNDEVILIDMKSRQLNQKYLSTTHNNMNYLISKLLIGDISDNIACCFICKDFLNEKGYKNNSRQPFIKCSKNLVERIIKNIGIYTYFCNIIDNIRNNKELLYKGYENNSETCNKVMCQVVKNEQFTRNLVMIDFKMLPNKLKNSLDEKIKTYLCL